MNMKESMASTIPDNFTILSILLFIASSCITAQPINTTKPHEKFLKCFLNQTKSSNSPFSTLIYTPETPSFYSIYNTTVQNSRFASTSGAMKPTFIMTPNTDSDVQAMITYSKANGLHLRVQSGIHDYEARSSYFDGDPFVVVNLTNFWSIMVDAAKGTAWDSTGATVGELYYNINTQAKKDTVTFSASLCTTADIGGIIGGGGLSTLLRKYGTSADNIMDASIIDLNGRILDRQQMGKDVFWATRGGGSTSFSVMLPYKV